MEAFSPGASYDTPNDHKNASPLASELTPLFEVIPIPLLLAALKTYRAGRTGYDKAVMLRTIIAMYYLNIPSFAALIRRLQDNPLLRRICGIDRWTEIPSRQAYSRFVTKLAHASGMVQRIVGLMTEKLGGTLPGLGEVVAIDSTDIKAFSNGNPKGKQHRVSDPDAGWIVKKRPNGKTGSTFGYKVHLFCDTTHEVPLAVNVTKGNVWDGHHALPLLSQARHAWYDFTPTVVLADAGYSWNQLRDTITDQWHALPLIDPNPSHPAAKHLWCDEWKALYRQRTSIERLNGRLKQHRRLNNLTLRGWANAVVHVCLSVLVSQALVLVTGAGLQVRAV